MTFACNICNTRCSVASLDREEPSCGKCGSNVRTRWIVHALSVELFGESLPLYKFPRRKKVRGIGLTDPSPIAKVLSRRFSYKNTFYHREPVFDIMAEPKESELDFFDFMVASEVFEHVEPPVQKAFDHLARLLAPSGFAVFSVPWELEGGTAEHFPDLHDWGMAKLKSGRVLVNRTVKGELETFENLNFHKGGGEVLEMRVFSRDGLIANCKAAGFTEISFAEDYPAFGIVWVPWSRGLILRKQASASERPPRTGA